MCIKELNAPSFYPSMISVWVTDSFERKDVERDLLTKLIINLAKPGNGMISEDQLIRGYATMTRNLIVITVHACLNFCPYDQVRICS